MQSADKEILMLGNDCLNVITSNNNPEEFIQHILGSYQILFNIKDLTWEKSQEMVSDHFISRIVNFEKSGISLVTLKKLELFTKSDYFNFDFLK